MVTGCKVVQWIFAVVMAVILLLVQFNTIKSNTILERSLWMVSAVVLIITAIIAYRFLKRRTEKYSVNKIDKIFWLIAFIVFILQIVFLICTKSEPIRDLKYVNDAASVFYKNWNTDDLLSVAPRLHPHYFATYPNNNALLVIISLIYKISYCIFGQITGYEPAIINTIGLSASFIMMYYIAKQLTDDKLIPLFTGILGSIYSIFYTYTAYFYTDSMSMPFVMGAILLFLKGKNSQKKISSILYFVFSALLLIIGYRIKGSVIILAVAFLIYLIIYTNNESLVNTLRSCGTFVLSLLVFAVAVNAFIGSFKISTTDESNEYQFPLTHWVMMGLKDVGGYNLDDFNLTTGSGNYEEKLDFNLDEIKSRLSNMGVTGVIGHICDKLAFTYNDGTYAIKNYIDKENMNPLKQYVFSGSYLYYCNSYHYMLLILVTISFVIGAKSKKIDKEILLRIIICGIILFFLIWETRSRYLVDFMPLFIILSAFSISRLNDYFFNKFNTNQKNI